MAQKFKKQHRNLESVWKVDLNEIQESERGRALEFHFVAPRNIIDENVVLKGLFHSACLARVVSLFAFVVTTFMGHRILSL